MADMVVLELKVFWKRGIILAEIMAAAPRIRALRDTLLRARGEEARLVGLKLAQLLGKALERKRIQEGAVFTDALGPLAREFRVKEMKADNLVLSAEFVVDRNRKTEFDNRVRELEATAAGRLTVACKESTADEAAE